MQGITSILDGAAESWWPHVFHGAWQAAVVAVVALVAARVLRRRASATLCYGLLLVAVVKFMVPPLVALPTGAFSWAVEAPSATPGTVALREPVAAVRDGAPEAALQLPPSVAGPAGAEGSSTGATGGLSASALIHDPSPADKPPVARSADQTGGAAPAIASPAAPTTATAAAPAWPRPTWLGALLSLHLAGMAAMTLWIAGSTFWLLRQVRRAKRVTEGPAHDTVRTLCATLGIRRKVRLLVGEDDHPPIAFGLLRPSVLLPRALAEQLDTGEARAILAHELAHHRRHDPWAIALENLALLVWWFHPLLWVLVKRSRQVREACCDDVVLSLGVSDSTTYCEGLLRTAVAVAGPGRFRMPLGHANALHPLGPRMKRIMDGTLRRSPKLSLASGLVVTLAALVALPGLRVADAHSTFPIEHNAEEAAAVRAFALEGLVAWYPMEGSPKDLSGNGNDGVTTDDTRLVPDRFGREKSAYAFRGNTAIVIANSDTLNLQGETALSILAWVKPGQVDGGRQALVEKWGGRMEEDDQYTLTLVGNRVEFGLSDESTRIAGGRVRAGAWHLVAGVYDPEARRIAVYVDGQCVGEKELSYAIRATDQPVFLGAGESGLYRYTGVIDDVAISARAFSDEEILRMYQTSAADRGSAAAPDEVPGEVLPVEPKLDVPGVFRQIDDIASMGPVVFKGKYQHFSRGRQYGEPVEVTLRDAGDGLVGESVLFGTRHAFVSKDGTWFDYWTVKPAADGKDGYGIYLKCGGSDVRVTRRGIRDDLDDKHLPVPEGAVFDPNSRPDPYLAAQVFMRRLNLKEGEERTLEVYDWDNQGEGMASYTIWFKHAGKETITVPAGTFETNHIVQQQKTFGDTWFKKRPGHVTDFYILDDGTIIRVYRHREPYELQLHSVEVPAALPQVQEAGAPQAEETAASEVSPPPAAPEAAHYFPLETEGAVVFSGTYGHFAGGQSYGAPGELTVYQAADGTLSVAASFRGTDYQAVSTEGLATDAYVSGSVLLDGSVQYRSHKRTDLKPGVVIQESQRLGEDPKLEEFPVPEGAVFDPNTRPDPYVVAQIMMRRLNLEPGGERTVEVYDTDNQGDGMAAYTIWFRHAGKESVTVPAGTFEANHIILQQQTSADTWFKKRAGHVTDFYVLDDGTIVRIYRHREPYEVQLLSMEGGEATAQAEQATRTDEIAKVTPLPLVETFDDGDFTQNPAWEVFNEGSVKGTVEVVDGTLHIVRRGSTARNSGRSDGGTGIILDVNIPVTDQTEIIFDARPVFRDMAGGAGASGRNHPVSVTAVLETPDGKEITLRSGVNYDCEVAHVSSGNYRQRGIAAAQGEWMRDMRLHIREAAGTLGRITHLGLVSYGWDYEAYIDNFRVVNSDENTPFDAKIAPVTFPAAPPTLVLPAFTPVEGPRKEVLWTDTPITVAEGDTVYIQASGKMGYYGGTKENIEMGPDGQGMHPIYQKYFHEPKRSFMALLGRFGLDAVVSDDGRSGSYGPGFVGRAIKSTKTTPGNAVLRLGVNDMTGNNSGAYAVKIWQVRGGKVLTEAEALEAPVERAVPGAPALEVEEARYGRGERWEDVTEKVRAHREQIAAGLNVSEVLGRAPWDRMNCALELRYRAHGVEKTAIAPQGGVMQIGAHTTSTPKEERNRRMPEVVSMAPDFFATEVDPATTEIRVTFDQDMGGGFSWTGGGERFPKTTGKPQWLDRRTCVLPVALEAGRLYRVGINAASYNSFKGVNGVPARNRVLTFTTAGASEALVDQLTPPRIVRMVPANDDTEVDPGLTEMSVTFDKPMGGGFSWTGGGPNYPKGTGRPQWSEDKRTCTRAVTLEPNHVYRLGLNGPQHLSFSSETGVPLSPVIWEFKTRAEWAGLSER